MFDVNPTLIRFWESKFDILRPERNKKGNRLFTPRDIDNFKLIYHLVKERGMTLDGAARKLKAEKQSIARDARIMDGLLSIRAKLLEIKQELDSDSLSSDEETVTEPIEPPKQKPAKKSAPVQAVEPLFEIAQEQATAETSAEASMPAPEPVQEAAPQEAETTPPDPTTEHEELEDGALFNIPAEQPKPQPEPQILLEQEPEQKPKPHIIEQTLF